MPARLRSFPLRAIPLRLLLLCLLLLSGYLASQSRLAEHLQLWLDTRWQTDTQRARALWLQDFRVEVEALPLADIHNNLSGLTHDPERNLLWAVTNGPNLLLGLSEHGDVVHRFSLDGFHDVEAVAWLGNDQLAVLEERRQSLVLLQLPLHPSGIASAQDIAREQQQILTLALWPHDNNGPEGLSYDRKGDHLYLVKERKPRQLLKISGLASTRQGRLSLHIRNLSDWLDSSIFTRDLSSVEIDPDSGHLLLLSDESQRLIETTDTGQVVSFLPLKSGFAGLQHDIPQAEGVTLDDQGRVFVVSEPNLFYRFARPTGSQQP